MNGSLIVFTRTCSNVLPHHLPHKVRIITLEIFTIIHNLIKIEFDSTNLTDANF